MNIENKWRAKCRCVIAQITKKCPASAGHTHTSKNYSTTLTFDTVNDFVEFTVAFQWRQIRIIQRFIFVAVTILYGFF